MNLFPDLRADLVGAMDRGPRSRRAPIALAVAAIAALLAFGATTIDRPARPAVTPAATPTLAPEPLPPAIATAVSGHLFPGSPVLLLRVSDESGLDWDAAMWATPEQSISLTQAVAGAREPQWGTSGWGTASIASQLRTGHLAGFRFGGAEKDGGSHYVALGIVDGRAKGVAVTLRGERHEAALSPALLTRPLAGGGELTVRLFAAAFEGPTARTLQPRVIVTLANGESWSGNGPRYCVSRRCGTPLPRIG
jgi:hypothetical protein